MAESNSLLFMSNALQGFLDEEHLERISRRNNTPEEKKEFYGSFVTYSKTKSLLTITTSEKFLKDLVTQEDLVFHKSFFGVKFNLTNDELEVVKNSDGSFFVTLRVISTEQEEYL